MKCIEPVTHGCIGGRAHSAGIVYRDLKPENVMITADGRAKTLTSVSPSRSCPNRPQARDLVTETGMVFGTVPYMSPEQARGEEVDYRSDQFSWGVVIHEMVTGTHPFRRDTGVRTLSAIIAAEPRPIEHVRAQVPAPLRWIIERCLSKQPSDRDASTADLESDLALLLRRISEADGDLVTGPRRPRRERLLALTAASAVLLAASLEPFEP